MTFVRPTKTVWGLTHLIQKLGFITAVFSQLILLHFLMPFLDFKVLPKIDHNPYLALLQEKGGDRLKETFTYKMTYDTLLFGIFFLQHIIMARPSFKQWMNELTNNQYYYLERPIYILSSGMCELYVLFKFEPVTEQAWGGFNSTFAYLVSWWLTLCGLYFMLKSKSDMLSVPSDPYGFGFLHQLQK